jgi:UDP-N-acetyl-D-glucosamine dehydrogenase
VLGLAYKRNAGDARESPAVALIHRLVADGAEVAVADPHVVEEMAVDEVTRRVALSPEEVERADAVVLVTDHDAFDYDMVQRHAKLILDTRHRLDGPDVEQL